MKTLAALITLALTACQPMAYKPLESKHSAAPRVSTYQWSKIAGNYNNPFLARP